VHNYLALGNRVVEKEGFLLGRVLLHSGIWGRGRRGIDSLGGTTGGGVGFSRRKGIGDSS
jgi:hypothetical protein